MIAVIDWHYNILCGVCNEQIDDTRHEKTDLKVFVLVIPKEGWVRMAAPILLLE